MRQPTILIADDHAIVAEGLAALLRNEFTVLGTAPDGAGLLEMARKLMPDVIITDMVMPGMSGLDALRHLRADAIRAKVIFLTMHADVELAAAALGAGASGFIAKHDAWNELIFAIRQVLEGRVYLTPRLSRDNLTSETGVGKIGQRVLTPRQRDVLQLIVEGRTMKEIAATLGLSARTVETHKYQMMETLKVETTAQLIRHAVEHRLAGPFPPP
jgi:DNA-binding NarL/FixJ family response regulator